MTSAVARAAGCRGKKQFLSWERANKAAGRSRRSRMHDGDILRPYRCRFCQFWHVGGALA